MFIKRESMFLSVGYRYHSHRAIIWIPYGLYKLGSSVSNGVGHKAEKEGRSAEKRGNIQISKHAWR